MAVNYNNEHFQQSTVDRVKLAVGLCLVDKYSIVFPWLKKSRLASWQVRQVRNWTDHKPLSDNQPGI